MKKSVLNALALVAAFGSTGTIAQVGPSQPKLPPGLYVSVTDGQIVVSNKGGTANFSAGQFGFTASVVQPPIQVPKNPAIQFTPPPAFNQSTSGTSLASSSKSGGVDCIVR
ncbi:MAG: hypothetical protein JWQ72_842 [Polaromonas sp.]|nr:hypothetical protein [Polaromonas sp.]